VTNAYATWDSLYFYAGFDVHDTNVISTNEELTSQPQQDDDIEVFFASDGVRASSVRTAKTFQMAVSAAGGAYFSVGDGTRIPVPKAIYDYKFDATVDGTINATTDTDRGYTIEIAIPWSELGLATPPQVGATWGFNVISRDRDSMQKMSTSFYSLSPLVKTAADVQDPSKWAKITFANNIAGATPSADGIVASRVAASSPPVVDGVLRSGEYPPSTRFAFGDSPILAAAPTTKEEPNVTTDSVPTPVAPSGSTGLNSGPSPTVTLTPTVPVAPVATDPNAPTTPATPGDYNIYLPSGGIVRVGKVPPPAPVTPGTVVTPPTPGVPGQPNEPTVTLVPPKSDGKPTKPSKTPIFITPDGPVAGTDITVPDAPVVDTSSPPVLPVITRVSPRLMATYVLNQPASPAIDAYLDQPVDALGNWFGAMRGQYVTDQLRDARISGIQILLPEYNGKPADTMALRSLVQAMKLMIGGDNDYPLLGLRLKQTGDDYAAIASFFSNVPPQFRAEVNLGDAVQNRRAYVVLADHQVDADDLRTRFERDFAGKATLAIASTVGASPIKVSVVSPGSMSGTTLTPRLQSATYEASWAAAEKAAADWIVVDSWNNFEAGNEIAISRQYNDQYANLTRVHAVTRNDKPWSAAFLQNDSPTQIAPKTLYEVHVRVENNGTLPWAKNQSYALSYRWYSKEGKLIDESAPHISFTDDILPGESTDVTVGLVATNSYGTSIDPGDYYLVYDIVQGQHKWFSYTGNSPLKMPVTVLAATDTAADKLTFLSTNTPQFVKPGATYYISVKMRNDGSKTWANGTTTLTHTISSDGVPAGVAESTALPTDVTPGGVATISLPVQIPANAKGTVTLGWAITNPDYKGGYVERLAVTNVDPGAVFVLTDVSRHFKTGEKAPVTISLYNESPEVWRKKDYRVGYRWAYLDGTPAGPATTAPATLPGDVESGTEVAVTTEVRAPDFPGRYNLVWDLILADGTPAANVETITRPRGLLPLQMWVVADRNARAVPVDLKASFNSRGVAFEGETTDGFDGAGASIPGEMLPPDGTREIDGNPLLIGKPGPNLYPSGYYSSSTGSDWASNHRISYLFPGKRDNNIVAAKGQSIDLPDGEFSSIHILAAAASDVAVDAEFTVLLKGATSPAKLKIAPWTTAPSAPGATVGFKAPYRLVKGSPDTSKPCILGDYTITLPAGKKLSALTLPNDPRIKILGITLER
jgi:hypothetical protein